MRTQWKVMWIIGVVMFGGTNLVSAVNDSFDFLIIAPDDLAGSFDALVEHKQLHGIASKIVSLDDVYSSVYFPVQGRDDTEKIKYFIKDAHEQWGVQYVMLVGGKDTMPVRYAVLLFQNASNKECIDGALGFSLSHSLGTISDLYYADLYDANGSFCSWDSNNNSEFGEVGYNEAVDVMDLRPDICVGRVLCATPGEVQTLVEKIITYEETTFGQEWFNTVVLCGGDTHPYTWEELLLSIAFKNITGQRYRLAWEGDYMGDQVAKILAGFTAKKLYASGLFGLRARSLSVRNINAAINEGAGFVLFSMHGSPTSLVTYPPFHKKQMIQVPFPYGYQVSDIAGLTNAGRLPIVVCGACSNGDFDTATHPIAWELVNDSGGGAIGCFALTSEGNLYPTTMCTESLTGFTTMSVFEAYTDGVNCLGEVWAETITRYLDDPVAWSVSEHLTSEGGYSTNWLNYLALQEWMLFGDPSLRIGGYAS